MCFFGIFVLCFFTPRLFESLFYSVHSNLCHRKKREDDVQCSHLTSRWKCMHIKWLSQCQRAFTAVAAADRENLLKQRRKKIFME